MKTSHIALTAVAGAGIGYFIGKEIGDTEDEKNENSYWGLAIGALIVVAVAWLINYIQKNKRDTVNYTLYDRKKPVYTGICYDHRFEARLREHAYGGKKFTSAECDIPKPRHHAVKLEKSTIQKLAPKYNIQHNRP